MAQGVAWAARELGVPATIAVPEHAPEAKLAAIARLGGDVRKMPYDDWWNIIVTSHVDGVEGLFVHPVQDPGGDGRATGRSAWRSWRTCPTPTRS